MNIDLLAPLETPLSKLRRLKVVLPTACTIAGVWLLDAPKTDAGSIQYTYSFLGNGSLGGLPFDTRPFTLSMSADTTTVVEIPASTRANTNRGAVTLEIGGLGSALVTTPLQIFTNFAYIGLSKVDGDTYMVEFGPIPPTWDLRSAVGPITLDPGVMNGWSVETDRGALAMGTTSNWQFIATTIPEPASCALIGFAAIGLLARRRR
jgi:hypothetical protein